MRSNRSKGGRSRGHPELVDFCALMCKDGYISAVRDQSRTPTGDFNSPILNWLKPADTSEKSDDSALTPAQDTLSIVMIASAEFRVEQAIKEVRVMESMKSADLDSHDAPGATSRKRRRRRSSSRQSTISWSITQPPATGRGLAASRSDNGFSSDAFDAARGARESPEY